MKVPRVAVAPKGHPDGVGNGPGCPFGATATRAIGEGANRTLLGRCGPTAALKAAGGTSHPTLSGVRYLVAVRWNSGAALTAVR